MNALILKEGRLLLRGFLVMAALILGVIWIPSRYEGLLIVTSFILCPAAVLMLAIDSFGREFSSRTFSDLLSLPVSRERVWWVKSLLLAVAMLVLWVVWWKAVLWKFESQPGFRQSTWLVQWGSLVYLLVAYSGGLWATLLCRQVAAAAWVAILVPFGVALMLTNWQWDLSARVWIWVFACYGAMGVVVARWLYLRAQDVSGVTEELEHSRWDGLRRRFASVPSGGASSSSMALIWKEFQLHHSYLLVGVVLAVVHVGAVVARHVFSGWQGNQMLKFVLESAWMLWMVMPWMIGCSIVAEERRMRMWESQLCAPVARWRQILVKVGVGGMLGMLLGGVMPVLIDRSMVMEFMGGAGSGNGNEPGMFRVFASQWRWFEATSQFLLQWLPVGFDLAPLFQYWSIVLVVVSVSIFASSLARTTIQALGPALLGMLLFFLGWTYLRNPEEFRSAAYWAGPIGLVIAVPLMGGVFLVLLYRNALRSESGWALWRMNVLGIVGGLGVSVLLSAGMYHRVWERVMTLEPVHGAPVWVRAKVGEPWSGPRIMQAQGRLLQVRFPDGRSWLASPAYRSAGLLGMLGEGRDLLRMGTPRVVEGSNWVSAVINPFDTVAVKEDGTLWVSEKPRFGGVMRLRVENDSGEEPRLVRYGTENDWKAAVSSFNAVFLLKNNGSLWRLGKDQWEGRGWPGLRSMEITRLGTENDWETIKSLWSMAVVFLKKDGRAFTWNWNMGWANTEDVLRFDEKTVFQRTTYLDSLDSEYLASVGVEAKSLKWFLPSFLLGLGKDGVLKLVAAWSSDERGIARNVAQRNVEIGADKDWVGLASSQGRAVTLKSDGTLWLWKFSEAPDLDPDSATRTQLGRRSDWVAISEGYAGVLTLAADGSLWRWKFNPGGGFSRGNSWFPLLGASSRPERIAQILPGGLGR